MASRVKARTVDFHVRDGYLVRTVAFPGGRPGYAHACPLAAYDAVAHAAGETPQEGRGTTMNDLVAALGLPYTAVDVALDFLRERGVLVTRRRRHYPASAWAYEDALCEYHALRERAPGA